MPWDVFYIGYSDSPILSAFSSQLSNKLILGMVEDTPFVQFLKDYNHIDTIYFCLDSDETAHKALYGKKGESGSVTSKGLVKKYEEQGYITDVLIQPFGKDFNEALLNQKNSR